MKAIVALILPIALFVSRSTIVVHAFYLRPYQVGKTTRERSGYHRLPKLVKTYEKYGDIIDASQSLHSFTEPSVHCIEKQDHIRRILKIVSPFIRRSNKLLCRLRILVASVALFLLINLSVLPASAAGSNGRMGGSFRRSDRYRSPPISKTIRPTRIDGRIPAPTRVMYPPRRLNRNRIYHNFHQANGEQVAGDGVSIMSNTDGTTSYARKVNTHPFANSRFSASDVVLVSGVTAVLTNGVMKRKSDRKKYDDDDLSRNPLGPGISVWCMTACLNVPNLNARTSIVRRLQRLAETTSTETRKGLQNMLAETSLELLRQLDKGSVVSIESRCDHYRSSDQAIMRAERQYNRISTRERSKFDRESWSSYNGSITTEDTEEREDLSHSFTIGGTSSLALVQIHLVIEGDTMGSFGQRQMETQRSFRAALVQLSGDVIAVDDCIVAGEVLWAPQQQKQHQAITEEDVYASYPTLWPVDYGMK